MCRKPRQFPEKISQIDAKNIIFRFLRFWRGVLLPTRISLIRDERRLTNRIPFFFVGYLCDPERREPFCRATRLKGEFILSLPRRQISGIESLFSIRSLGPFVPPLLPRPAREIDIDDLNLRFSFDRSPTPLSGSLSLSLPLFYSFVFLLVSIPAGIRQP